MSTMEDNWSNGLVLIDLYPEIIIRLEKVIYMYAKINILYVFCFMTYNLFTKISFIEYNKLNITSLLL